jgi:hypothetical protein
MLSLYDCRLVLLVHTFDRLATVSLEVFVAGLDRVSDVDDFLLPEIFEVHVFGPTDFLLVLMDLDLHFVDKPDSHGVQKLGTEPVPHVGQDNKKEGPAASVFAVLDLKLFLFLGADHCIKEPPQSRDKFFMRIICASFVLLFLPLLFYFKQVVLRTGFLMDMLGVFILKNIIISHFIFLFSFYVIR